MLILSLAVPSVITLENKGCFLGRNAFAIVCDFDGK
jgi:hypothetical protein